MNLPVRRELQLVGSGSCLVEDREGADLFVVQLLLWSWEAKIGSIQPDLVADLVVVHFLFLLVVLLFHVFSGFFEGVTRFGVDLGHFLHEVTGSGVGEGVVLG